MNISISTSKYINDDGERRWAAYVNSGDLVVSCHGKTENNAKKRLYKKVVKMMRFLPEAREALAINLGYMADYSKQNNEDNS